MFTFTTNNLYYFHKFWIKLKIVPQWKIIHFISVHFYCTSDNTSARWCMNAQRGCSNNLECFNILYYIICIIIFYATTVYTIYTWIASFRFSWELTSNVSFHYLNFVTTDIYIKNTRPRYQSRMRKSSRLVEWIRYSQSILKRQIEREWNKQYISRNIHLVQLNKNSLILFNEKKKRFGTWNLLLCPISCMHFSSVPHDHETILLILAC